MKQVVLASLALLASASVAAAQDWKAQWQSTIAAAEQEGTVVVDTVSDQAWQEFVAKEFPAAFPKIRLEATRLSPPDFVARVRIERAAGKYLWDVAAAGPNPMYALYKDGAVDPILPELILPEAKDETAWGGWNEALIDTPHRYVFSMSSYISSPFYNAAFVPPEKVQQLGFKVLLDPAYKGKIAWQEPTIPGSGHSFALDLREHLGDDGFKQLILDQHVIFDRNMQTVVEDMARGIVWFTIGPATRSLIAPYVQAGAGVKTDLHIIGNQPDRSHLTDGGNTISVMNQRPHPNAALVFVNWILQKDVQSRLAKAMDEDSRRNDIPPVSSPDEARLPGAKYLAPPREEEAAALEDAVGYIQLLRRGGR
jgi:iron(III) transport system substrate-binding protein